MSRDLVFRAVEKEIVRPKSYEEALGRAEYFTQAALRCLSTIVIDRVTGTENSKEETRQVVTSAFEYLRQASGCFDRITPKKEG